MRGQSHDWLTASIRYHAVAQSMILIAMDTWQQAGEILIAAA